MHGEDKSLPTSEVQIEQITSDGGRASPSGLKLCSWLTALDSEPNADAKSIHDWCTLQATCSLSNKWADVATAIIYMLLTLFISLMQVFCLWTIVYVSLGCFHCSSLHAPSHSHSP